MLIKQISIFLENKSGRLAEVTRKLGENDIDLIAISISDTTDFGILRIIVNKPESAESMLRQEGLTVSCNQVIAIAVHDQPGGLSSALNTLADNSIDIEYMYAVGKNTSGAVVILRVEDKKDALKVLQDGKIQVLSSDEVYKI